MVVKEVDYSKVKANLLELAKGSIFEETIAHIKWNRANGAYGKVDTLEHRFNELSLEISEVKKEVESGDIKLLAEELGDVMWDLLFLLEMCEEKGVSIESVLRGRIEKQVRRGPQIYEPQEEVTCAEELEIWNKAKKKEKSGELKGLGF